MKNKFYLTFGVLFCWTFLSFHVASGQNRISGTVVNEDTNEPLNGTTIRIENSNEGTFTNSNGEFSFTTQKELPLRLVFSSVGYATQSVTVSDAGQSLAIRLSPSEVLGEEVVVAASRVEENILTSPVSIESIGQRDLKTSASSDYYNVIGNLKGINMVTSSLLFSTPTTRGFASSGNVGFNQFSDGMDNEAPGLNFSVSTVLGISPLDLDKVEMLPGASSALYGAGGTNGTLIMTSKDPFEYQGLSAEVKGGIMHVNDENHKVTPYQNYSVRYAKAFNNKFAFKVNVNYVKAYDWMAADTSNYDAEAFKPIPGTRQTDPSYDGVNVFGDEDNVGANLQDVTNSVIEAGRNQFIEGFKNQTGTDPSETDIQNFLENDPTISPFYNGMQNGLIPNQLVSRTGYNERDVVDYHAYNLKLGGELAYKITPDTKVSLMGNWGKGTTVYTGSDRYSLTGFSIGQYKLEVNGKRFMLRGYTTQENSGDAFNGGIQGQLMTENAKHGSVWFPEYVGAYLQGLGAGADQAAAHAAARTFADRDFPQPGSSRFEQVKDSIAQLPIPFGGKFTERSSLWNYEGLYDFTEQIPFVDLQVGANYRRYHLNSKGTLFDDTPGKLTSDQAGGFLQATKRFWDEKIKLTGAIRYDKMENFDGKWTPRIALVYEFVPRNNLRISYQTGYQMPTNQQQYIDLNVIRARLIGGIPSFFEKYDMESNPTYVLDNVTQEYAGAVGEKTAELTASINQKLDEAGMGSVESLGLTDLVQAIASYQAEDVLHPYEYKPFKPETVRSFEVGYRGVINRRLMIDAYVYFSNYEDFISQMVLLQPKNGPQPLFTQAEQDQIPPAAVSLAPLLGLDPALLTDPPLATGRWLSNEQTRNVYQMYTNSDGKVKTWGWALGADYLFPKNYKMSANVTYNKMKDAPESYLAMFNVPDYTVNVGINNPNVIKNFGFGVNYHWQNGFNYESGFASGWISAYNTLDLQLTYYVPKIKVNFALGGTNVLNHYYKNGFGNPRIGGLYYASIGYNIF